MMLVPGPHESRRRAGRPAFTLIELLVVIAVIGILAGVLLPALGRVKSRGQAVVWLNNHRQLMVSCLLYVDDHDDSFPYNLDEPATRETIASGKYLNWVNNVMTPDLDPLNTNTALIGAGGIGPYCSGTAGIYRCPTDFALDVSQRNAGWRHRTRSISMNAMVGNAGAITSSGANSNNPTYQQFFKLSQVPSPSQIFVFIEEHPDTIDDGYFINKYYSPHWRDLPASYHDGAAHLAFADGHIEKHKWMYATTKPPPVLNSLPPLIQIDDLERGDFNWLMYRASLKSAPPPPPQ